MGYAWKEPVRVPRWLSLSLDAGSMGGSALLVLLGVARANYPTSTFFSVTTWIVGAITFVSVLTLKAIALIGSTEKKYIECLLEKLGCDLWADKLTGEKHQHRITLFQAKKCRWGGKKWSHILVPRARFPKAQIKPRRAFRVHEYYSTSEGVAGLAYCTPSAAIVTETLPRICYTGVTDQEIAEYARLTNDKGNEKKLKRKPHRALVMGAVAIPASVAENGRWGVLVLDSTDPNAVEHAKLSSDETARVLGVLTAIIEKGGR